MRHRERVGSKDCLGLPLRFAGQASRASLRSGWADAMGQSCEGIPMLGALMEKKDPI